MALETRPRPPFENIALVLQGGGALGAYQAGVYQALHEEGMEPDWVCGVSMSYRQKLVTAGIGKAAYRGGA